MDAALWAHRMVLGKPGQFVLKHTYWGEGYGRGTVQAFLQRNDLLFGEAEEDHQLLQEGCYVHDSCGTFPVNVGSLERCAVHACGIFIP